MSTTPTTQAARALEGRINETGSALFDALQRVLESMPDRPQGPQALAGRINIDKVLASRVLKAMRAPDTMSVMHRIPGPEPLRRFLRAISRHGVAPDLVDAANQAIDRFASLIRDDLGDRGALDAIVSAWVPEARREFELRSKQAAYRSLSQIRGAQAEAILATALLHPSEDSGRLDLVWVSGLIGLIRLRPGAGIKLATRRMVRHDDGRHPQTLQGRPSAGFDDGLLPEFSTSPAPQFGVERVGEVVHYSLADAGFGPSSSVDIVLAEVNRSEMRRFIGRDEQRKGFIFAETSVPTKALQFDALVHRDVYPGSTPSLRIYDTAMEGVADVNDPARDIDQLQMLESIESLGESVERIGSSSVPRYGQLIGHVCASLGWDPGAFRAYRCRIDYPVYGSQVAMCFDPPRADG